MSVAFAEACAVDYLRPFERGPWSLRKKTISESEAAWTRIRAIQDGRGALKAGSVVWELKRGGVLWMSDTPDEKRDHHEAIYRAAPGARCRVHGLGLGMVAVAMARRGALVDVVEIDAELAAEIREQMRANLPGAVSRRITVIEGDAFEIKGPVGLRYDVVWHDIWTSLCSDNLEEMKRLHRSWGRRTVWQGSWGRAYLERRR